MEEKLVAMDLYTVFVPENSSFDRLPEQSCKALFAVEQILESTLLNHIAPGILDAVDLLRQGTVTTLGGLSQTVEQDDILLVGGARIIKPDLQADNGMLHIVDRLVAP